MKPTLLALPTGRDFADRLADAGGFATLEVDHRHFPDGESYVRLPEGTRGDEVAVVASLHPPNTALIDAILAAETAREAGAERVGLVAPYLAYLRQDDQFRDGEGVTSRYVADLVSARFDWLTCVDPHLHRWDSLEAIYSIPTWTVSAASAVADWVESNVERPVVIGPDDESAQWVEPTAGELDAPRAILSKERTGDRSVSIHAGDLPDDSENCTPIILDDIISSGGTMIEAVRRLREHGFEAPVCVGVHGLFADEAYDDLIAAGAREIVTTDTVEHHTNAIRVAGAVAEALRSVEM